MKPEDIVLHQSTPLSFISLPALRAKDRLNNYYRVIGVAISPTDPVDSSSLYNGTYFVVIAADGITAWISQKHLTFIDYDTTLRSLPPEDPELIGVI